MQINIDDGDWEATLTMQMDDDEAGAGDAD